MSGAARGAGPIRIRAGRPDDAPAVARVMRAAVRGLPAGACTPRQRAAWSSLPPLYHRWAMGPGGERYLVAERGGRVVGYAACRGARPGAGATRAAELTAVFVSPAAGGAGLGRRLVRAVEARARRGRAPALVLLAAGSAVGFYAALGFVPGARTSSPLPGGVRLPAVRMRKALPHPHPRARPGAPSHRGRAPA